MGLLDDAIREHLDLKRQRGADPGEVERLEREALGPVRREPTGRAADAVPQLEVQVDPEQEFEPATELLQDASVTRSPKRGFLRRNRSPATRQPERSDFAEPLGTGLDGAPGASRSELSDHPDPFGQDQFDSDDPFPQDEPSAGVPEVGAEPPQLIFDDPLPKRPRFAPVPPSTTEPEAQPVDADTAGFEPEAVGDPEAAGEPAPPAAPAPDDRSRADDARETREWSVEEAFADEDTEHTAPVPDPVEEDVLEETPEFLQDTPDHDRLWFEQRPPRDFDFDG